MAKHVAEDTYSAAELLALAQKALAEALDVGIGRRTANGREVTAARLAEMKEVRDELKAEARLEDAASNYTPMASGRVVFVKPGASRTP